MYSDKDWTVVFRVGKPVFEVSWEEVGGSCETTLRFAKKLAACQYATMKKRFPAVLAALAAMFAVSCAPSTPAYRISMRPSVYERLSEKDKQLVRYGEIAEGMDQDAVALAWGSPSSRVEGLRSGKRMQRWDYRGSEPVMTAGFFGGYRSGAYGPYRDLGIGAGFAPEVTYLPTHKASVWFIDGRVEEWERVR